MTNDPNFWKNRYKFSWQASKEREDMVGKKILDETGKSTEFVGLGAGTDRYMEGSAQSQGYDKGGADLHVVGTSVYIEVTGPLITTVPEDAPLWLRPDKVESASKHFPARETWVVHHIPKNDLLRVVRLDEVFFRLYKDSQFRIVEPIIRGQKERYVEIPSTDPHVLPWDKLISRLKAGA